MTREETEIVLDLLGLEPPEPLVRTLETLDRLGAGQRLRIIVPHEPFPLYRALAANQFSWQTEFRPDGAVEVLIEQQPA